MGLRLVQLVTEDPRVELGWAIDRPDHPRRGEDAGVLAATGPLGVPLSTLAQHGVHVDAMIDFSHPLATLELARACAERSIPLVVGTTGLTGPQRRAGTGRGADPAAALAEYEQGRESAHATGCGDGQCTRAIGRHRDH